MVEREDGETLARVFWTRFYQDPPPKDGLVNLKWCFVLLFGQSQVLLIVIDALMNLYDVILALHELLHRNIRVKVSTLSLYNLCSCSWELAELREEILSHLVCFELGETEYNCHVLEELFGLLLDELLIDDVAPLHPSHSRQEPVIHGGSYSVDNTAEDEAWHVAKALREELSKLNEGKGS